jgi:hypothetical protein
MVRRGSTVRVRQRALPPRNTCKSACSVALGKHRRAPPCSVGPTAGLAVVPQSACKSPHCPVRRSTSVIRRDSPSSLRPRATKVAGNEDNRGSHCLSPRILGTGFGGQAEQFAPSVLGLGNGWLRSRPERIDELGGTGRMCTRARGTPPMSKQGADRGSEQGALRSRC